MRADTLVANQLLMAQAVDALADHIGQSTGFQITPVLFADLPASPGKGMIACITDSTVVANPGAFGSVVSGGGSNTELIWFNGTDWTVIGI